MTSNSKILKMSFFLQAVIISKTIRLVTLHLWKKFFRTATLQITNISYSKLYARLLMAKQQMTRAFSEKTNCQY